MLDEVHLLAENRGPSLEAIVSRLKLSKGLAMPARFMACSATFQNVEDVAHWLGAPPRAMFTFGNEMRPVPLEINIKTYQSNSNNEFLFLKKLDDHVYPVLMEYANGKPALCFCTTKAETARLAKKLSSEYRTTSGQSVFVRDAEHRSLLIDESQKVWDEGLKKSIREGVGYHNADLSMEDKAVVEALFAKKQLPILATTSTLAMGINLPAHLVIIKGVRVYRGNSKYAMLDYSSILQMIGRAGRPQFDVKGVAVIMAQPKDRPTLENILNLSEVVESSLLECLAECLNAEICNGMVTDVISAIKWIETTYLYVRIMKNPAHYGVPSAESIKGRDAIVTWLRNNILGGTISKLVSRGMVRTDESGFFISSTAPGILMAENYVRLGTMSLIAKLGTKSTMEDFAWVIAGSVELTNSLVVRRNEKKWLNKINSSALARYSIKDVAKPGSKLKRIQLPSQKAFALMMFDLSSECRAMIKEEATRYAVPIQGLIRDARTVVSKGSQICKCIIRFFEATNGTANALCEALVFRKVLDQRLWPDDPFLITQIRGIGETIATRLVNSKISTLSQILSTDARQLEVIAGLRPPQGTVIQDNASKLCPPPLRISARIEEHRTTMVADITIRETHEEGSTSLARQNDRWCRILVYISSSNALLINRRIRYSRFGKGDGLRFQVDTCSPPDADGNVIVRVIDEIVLGVDVRAAIPLLPSTEAESSRPGVGGGLSLDGADLDRDITRINTAEVTANALELKPKAKAKFPRKQTVKVIAVVPERSGPSPTAQQTKLNFGQKKRPRITSESADRLDNTERIEKADVIQLLDDTDDEDTFAAENTTEKITQKTTEKIEKIEILPEITAEIAVDHPVPERVTMLSEVAKFDRSYAKFMEGFEFFLNA